MTSTNSNEVGDIVTTKQSGNEGPQEPKQPKDIQSYQTQGDTASQSQHISPDLCHSPLSLSEGPSELTRKKEKKNRKCQKDKIHNKAEACSQQKEDAEDENKPFMGRLDLLVEVFLLDHFTKQRLCTPVVQLAVDCVSELVGTRALHTHIREAIVNCKNYTARTAHEVTNEMMIAELQKTAGMQNLRSAVAIALYCKASPLFKAQYRKNMDIHHIPSKYNHKSKFLQLIVSRSTANALEIQKPTNY